MTEGQGRDPYGQQGGPVQGGPPWYPAGGPPRPAQSWPDMPPPYPAYTPAPPGGYGYGAPPQLERPATVRAGLGAIVAGMVLSLVALIYQLTHFGELLDRALATAARNSNGVDTASAEDLAHTFLVAGMVFAVVWLCLQAMFVWFAWQGRNWARIVLWVIAGLGVLGGLVGVLNAQQPGFLRVVGVLQWLLVVAAIVLLALKPSNEWYRYRRWLRDTGQQG